MVTLKEGTAKPERLGREKPMYLRSSGFCPICEQETEFSSEYDWLRDHFKCANCGSIPRERALMVVIDDLFPNWRMLQIHETSPGAGGASQKLRTECAGYTYSHFDPAVGRSQIHPQGWQNEDVEAMSFLAGSFDIFIAQDVFEHLFHPERALKEIERVLAPRGALIMTVPLTKGREPSQRRAVKDVSGAIGHLLEAQYHGNPINAEGSLVTIDWGYDILSFIAGNSNLLSALYHFDDLSRGLRAAFLEVIVAYKIEPPVL